MPVTPAGCGGNSEGLRSVLNWAIARDPASTIIATKTTANQIGDGA